MPVERSAMQDTWVHKYHILAVLQISGHQNFGDVVNTVIICYIFNPHLVVFLKCSVLVPLDPSEVFDIAAVKGMEKISSHKSVFL